MLDLSERQEHHLDYLDWAGPSSTAATQHQFVGQMRSLLGSLGFFYLHNSPLESHREEIFDMNKRFFDLPLEERLKIDMVNSPHFRGYAKFGDERTQGLIDARDQIDFGPEVTALDDATRKDLPFTNLYGPNQFPADEQIPGHRAALLRWFEVATAVSRELTTAIEQALGVRSGRLLELVDGVKRFDQSEPRTDEQVAWSRLPPMPYARQKIVRYPAQILVDGILCGQDERIPQQGVGAHKDGGWLTLLATDAVPGLQLQEFDGNWLDVPHVEGSIIVNFGQQLEMVAGQDFLQAATHRVLSYPSSGRPRYSLPYFSMPALNVVMSPILSDEFDPELLKRWENKKREQGKAVTSDVEAGDLLLENRPFGEVAWKGISRSHLNVVERWHSS